MRSDRDGFVKRVYEGRIKREGVWGKTSKIDQQNGQVLEKELTGERLSALRGHAGISHCGETFVMALLGKVSLREECLRYRLLDTYTYTHAHIHIYQM